jgi:competence protein CoiA
VGETETHRRCKTEIYEAMCNASHVSKVGLERYLKTVRPDVSALIKDVYVAVEVQISNLPLDTVIHRTNEYTRMRIHLLWRAQWTPALDSDRYSPRPWECWLHAAHFGRVYYWKNQTTIIPYHFNPVFLDIPETEWYEPSGEYRTAGGHSRRSRRYRKPIRGKPLTLLTDFVARDRDAWQSINLKIPKAKLYCDATGKFW